MDNSENKSLESFELTSLNDELLTSINGGQGDDCCGTQTQQKIASQHQRFYDR